jgi:hypothetical protein
MRGMKPVVLMAAAVALIVPAAGTAARPGHRLDLSTGRVDGWAVLGRTPAGVRSLLGRPNFTGGPARRPYDIWGGRADWSTKVFYRREGSRLRAWSLVFERGPVVDPRLGNILVLRPTRFQAAVRDRYAATFELRKPYRCRSGLCTGIFDAIEGTLHITFGTTPGRGTFVTVWSV